MKELKPCMFMSKGMTKGQSFGWSQFVSRLPEDSGLLNYAE
jgi:hypothetical protein